MKNFTPNDKIFKNSKNIHMIGIGGSGMCPLAEILLSKKYNISGSDNNPGDTINRLKKLGAKIAMGHSGENISPDIDVVVYSAAISADNPEILQAKKLNIETLERSELLGYITRKYSNTIGISGTHGKTTATSMLVHTLYKSGLDPAAVIGGRLDTIDAYGRAGSSDTLVVESCEYNDTFLRTNPDVAVVLNIDADHMEYFKTIDNLVTSFKKFCKMAHTVIINGDDEKCLIMAGNLSQKIIKIGENENCDAKISNITEHRPAFYSFTLDFEGQRLSLKMSAPGRHNVFNGAVAAVCALLSGASVVQIEKNLPSFKGAGRRFEVLSTANDITIADDYAHHPLEIEVTLDAALKMGYNRVIAVFQPFTFSRTNTLLSEFAEVLSKADLVILSEIMGSREKNTFGIHTSHLCEKIPNAVWFKTFDEIVYRVKSIAKPGDLIITLGCGDIYKVAQVLAKNK